MPAGVLYILSKEPRPGFAKTRLVPPLSPEQAATAAAAFALDTCERLSGWPTVAVRLAIDRGAGPSGGVVEERARALGILVEDQGDGDLGVRMGRLIGRGVAGGAATVLVGSDSPDLPLSIVADAFTALATADVVLAPSVDGGYVLVGARRPVQELFDIDVAWGSEAVLGSTVERLERAGTSWTRLPAWEDVDDVAALGRLASRLQAGGGVAAPRSAEYLRQLRCEGLL